MLYSITNGEERTLDLKNLYRNAAVFVISSGPGLNSVDKSLFKKPGIVTFGINNSCIMVRPNLWVSVDTPYRFIESIWRDPSVMKFVCGRGKRKHEIARKITKQDMQLSKTKVGDLANIVYYDNNTAFDYKIYLDEPSVNWGCSKELGGARSVFLACIKIIFYLGFRRVYLNGVDFRMQIEQGYGFKEQRSRGAVRGNNSTYQRLIERFTSLIPQFVERNFQIFQCTPNSDLTIFPYMKLEDAIAKETAKIPDPAKEAEYGFYYAPNDWEKIDPVIRANAEAKWNELWGSRKI